jgi:hypothetical protein
VADDVADAKWIGTSIRSLPGNRHHRRFTANACH